MADILCIIFICSAVVYAVLIFIFTSGWFSIKHCSDEASNDDVIVSVVIPIKNEEENITHIFKDLISQDYPADQTEIIFIDDQSEDAGFSLLSSLRDEHTDRNIKLIQTDESCSGKKRAIEKAINESTGKLILTSDGDCRMGAKWISAMIRIYKSANPKMICGPVIFQDVNGLFGKFQAIEFLSLVASGAGSIQSGIPIMCNGANMAYEKEAFLEVGAYSGNLKHESGDDIFLLQKIKKNFGGKSVSFIKDQDAIVRTNPAKTLNEFFNQRKRWVSKSSGYTDFWMIITSIAVYFFSLSILLAFVLFVFYSGWIKFAVLLFCIKFIVDLPILTGISKFSKQSRFLWFYPIFQIIYIPYVVVIGIIGNFGKYRWK